MATALPLPSSYKPPAGGLPAVAFASPSDDPSKTPPPVKLGQGAAGEFAGNAVRAVAAPLQRTGAVIESGLDETVGRLATGIASKGKSFAPTQTGAAAFRAADASEAAKSTTLAGKLGTGVGVVAPYLLGAGEEEAEMAGTKVAAKTGSKILGSLAKAGVRTGTGTVIGTAQTGSVKKGLETGVGNTVGQGLLEGAGTLLKGALSDGAKSMSATGVATKRVSSTAETMTKAEREAAIKEGRMTPTGSGGKYMPSATEKRAGEILAGKTSSNPVKTVEVINKEIATRGKEAETYLEKAGTKVSNETDLKAFDSARASAEKYMTSAESKAYDEHIGIFQKILKTYTKDGGYTTANYYKALKDYEAQVTANLPKGKEALLKEGGSARLQAAKDVRGVVRDLIGKANPEFKGKMFDLASLYDAQDNVISKAEGLGTFAKRHPLLTKTGIYGAEAIGAGAIYKGAKSLGLPLP
jgi:hypothetical protein